MRVSACAERPAQRAAVVLASLPASPRCLVSSQLPQWQSRARPRLRRGRRVDSGGLVPRSAPPRSEADPGARGSSPSSGERVASTPRPAEFQFLKWCVYPAAHPRSRGNPVRESRTRALRCGPRAPCGHTEASSCSWGRIKTGEFCSWKEHLTRGAEVHREKLAERLWCVLSCYAQK